MVKWAVARPTKAASGDSSLLPIDACPRLEISVWPVPPRSESTAQHRARRSRSTGPSPAQRRGDAERARIRRPGRSGAQRCGSEERRHAAGARCRGACVKRLMPAPRRTPRPGPTDQAVPPATGSGIRIARAAPAAGNKHPTTTHVVSPGTGAWHKRLYNGLRPWAASSLTRTATCHRVRRAERVRRAGCMQRVSGGDGARLRLKQVARRARPARAIVIGSLPPVV